MKKAFFLLLYLIFIITCAESCNCNNEITELPFEVKEAIVFTTAFGTDLKFTPTDTIQFGNSIQPLQNEFFVYVNTNKRFQALIGIGGAITDASAEVFGKLNKEKQNEILNAYYNFNDGIGYNLARISIHSCDFSSESFTYIDDGDKEFKTFSIEHDEKFRIPLIKKAIETTGGNLLIYASPWSPPAFMKSNNSMLHGGKLLPEYYQPWANYFVKFIQSYAKVGIPMWGITIQNEPMAKQRWESCIYTADEERDFLKDYLGPTMENAGLGNTKIIVWDHNRDLLSHRANVIFGDPEAEKYAWGIGFHWYETGKGSLPMYSNELSVKEAFPTKQLIFTEGCVPKFNKEKLHSWENAERYGSQMINDFNCGTVAWTDWNIILDERGGPNHVDNYCFAPIHVDLHTGEIIYTLTYYYIGHFSKFIHRNARRVSTSANRSQLLVTSFLNESGKMVTVVMNGTNDEINYKLIVDNKEADVNILPHSIQSIIY